MKKKMLTTLLALVMMVSVIPGASAAGAQPQDDSSTIFRDPNRYYYTTEYSDIIRTNTFIITPEEALLKDAIKGALSKAMASFLTMEIPDPTGCTTEAVEALFNYIYSKEPFARAGTYTVSTRFKTKYKVDYLNPSHKVKVDEWIVYGIYLLEYDDDYTYTIRMK